MNGQSTSFGIAGGGTAGLITAIMLRAAFPHAHISIIASSDIGIVGVGEGSTEHWKEFMNRCRIPTEEMVKATKATHKYGIRFENWSNKYPDYFHSVSGDENVFAWGLYAVYMALLENEKELTRSTGNIGLFDDKIIRETLHESTNQFHFDTFALNQYLSKLCVRRGVKIIDATIEDVALNHDNGNISHVAISEGRTVGADFWFDATGFKRVLATSLGNKSWTSLAEYLLVDSAFAFPTPSDPSGKIRGYTRARALKSGWLWEIPTQERRGNGYVFSSQFTDVEQAVAEVSALLGHDIEPARQFKFQPGYLAEPWVKNCCAVGLASSFVEPLEATSIGSTIQMVKLAIPFVASYAPHHTASQRTYNKQIRTLMDNILTMIRLHYVTDRADTEFWRAANNAPVNDTLQELLDLWQETTLPRNFIGETNGEMFRIAHLLHVAQGQNVIGTKPITTALNNLGVRQWVDREMKDIDINRTRKLLVDHAEALREI